MPFIPELKRWAVSNPDRLAVSDGERALSYAQLLDAARAAAAELPAHDSYARGDLPVVVIEEGSVIELAVQWCAVLLTGSIAMVLDVAWPAAMREELRAAAQRWATGRPRVDAAANAPFLVGLSSGTSGTPKGFLRSEESWRESFVQSCAYFALAPGCVTLAPGPVSASMNLYALGESLFAGASFISLPRFSPDAALRAVVKHEVTHLVGVPTLLELIAARGIKTSVENHSLQRIICAGAALGVPTRELSRHWAPQVQLHQYYGAAELGFVAASSVLEGSLSTGVGAPFPGVTVAILDNQGMELPRGEWGNICVQSPFICDGYAWGDDGLAFGALGHSTPDGQEQAFWYTVHDQGWFDTAGELHVLGRAADMILSSGANVYPHEIESTLSAAASTVVLVTGIDDALRGQRVAAAIHARQGQDENTTLAACRQAAAGLPSSHRPTRWYVVTALPVTGSGKISRQLLSQWIAKEDPRVRRLQ